MVTDTQARSLAIRYSLFLEEARKENDLIVATQGLLEIQDKTGVELVPKSYLEEILSR